VQEIDKQQFLNFEQAAHFIGVHEWTLRRYIKIRKGPPFYKINGRYRFKLEDVKNWLESF
jgi:excisionase family DNA binding protein